MRLAHFLLAAACLVPAARATVHVVHVVTGDPSLALQAAIDGAGNGDILLLKDASYVGSLPYVVVAQRGLTLVIDAGLATVQVPPIVVTTIDAGETVVLRGLSSEADGQLLGATDVLVPAYLEDSADALIWIEDCRLTGLTGANGLGSAACIVSEALVAFIRSTLRGGDGDMGSAPVGGDALRLGVLAPYSRVAVLECAVQGGDAGSGPGFWGGGSGGHGISCANDVFVGGSSVAGGDEGADNDANPGHAGSGLYTFWQLTTLVFGRDLQLSAGAVQGLGTPGKANDIPAGEYGEFAASWRSLELPAVCRELQPGTLQVQGHPGDLVAVMLDTQAALSLPIASRQAPLLLSVQAPVPLLVLGSITAPDGSWDLPFLLPLLPPGYDGVRVFAQGLFAGADGFTLGSGSAMAWISSAF